MSFINVTARRGAIAAAVVILAALFAASVVSARPGVTRRSTASGSGGFARASLYGITVRRPAQIQVRVTVSPRQRVNVRWRLFCDLGNFNYASKSASATRSPPATIRIRLPAAASRIMDCDVSASVNLDDILRSGRVSVSVWAASR